MARSNTHKPATSAAPALTSRHIAPRLVIAVSAYLLCALLAAGRAVGVDDTFITLTYARNLVETGFPYWHPSLPPVEGFTSLGHVLLVAILHTLGPDPIMANAIVIQSSLALTIAALAYALRRMSLSAYATGLLALGACASLCTWVNNGLDAVVYMMVFFLTYLATLRAHEARRISIPTVMALGALALTRPEGMIITIAVLIHFWLVAPPSARHRRTSIALTAIPLVLIAALTLWRLWAFGHPLPNTFYAKASASRTLEVLEGSRYAWRWITGSFGGLLVATFIATRMGRVPTVHLCFVAGGIALVILEGGDSHLDSRFFLPLLPLLAIDVARLMNACARKPGLRVRAAALAALAFFCVRQGEAPRAGLMLVEIGHGIARLTSRETSIEEKILGPTAMEWAATAKNLATVVAPNEPIGAADVGAIAYFTRSPVLDALGLNHVEIAHASKPEGFANRWGDLRLDLIVDAAPPVIYPAYPWQTEFSFDDLASGRRACGPFGHFLSLRVKPFLEVLESSYVCTAVRYTEAGRVLNFLAHRTAFDTARLSGLNYSQSDCLPELVKRCPF